MGAPGRGRRGRLLLLRSAARGASMPGSHPASLAAGAPRLAAAWPPRARGGGRRRAPRRACCGRRAGQSRERGRRPPRLRFPGSGGSASAASPALGGRDREAAAPPGRRPHVTGGGAACSRHRPGGGSRGRARGSGLGALAGSGPATDPRWAAALAVDVGLRAPPVGALARAWLCWPRVSKDFFFLPGVCDPRASLLILPLPLHSTRLPNRNGTGGVRGA